MRTLARLIFWLLAGIASFCLASAQDSGNGSARPVYYVDFKEVVHRASLDYVARALQEAEKNDAGCFLIRLDTPGGELQATREMVQLFLASEIPIIMYVAPSGARAGSAGVFLTIASHVAVMAPGTNIGAATPVSGDGGEISKDMKQKVMNDTVAFARAIAKERGRNEKWVEKAVTEAASIPAHEALEQKVIDLIAEDMPQLLSKVDGRKVKVKGGETTLRTKGAIPVEVPRSWRENLLIALSNPNVFYILILLAINGILLELQNPGATLPGVVGVICLLLALYAASVLPINLLGVAMIVLAFVLLIMDLFAPTHGVLTFGAIVSFIIGSVILFQTDSPLMRVSYSLIGAMTVMTSVFFIAIVGSGIKAQFRKKESGKERLVGATARARSDLKPEGKVFLDGALWRAISDDGQPIQAGETVQVERIEGLTVYVRKVDAG